MKVPFIGQDKENRYQRQENIIGTPGQRRLLKSRAVIIGLGALGGVVSEILVRSGVGNIFLIDGDVVELVNLHRQTLYDEADVGKAKAEAAYKKLSRVNSGIKIHYEITDLTGSNIDNLLKRKDLVIDCTDNISARLLMNDYCRKKKLKWVSGSAVRELGRVISFTHEKNSPCYRCIYDNKKAELECAAHGVLNTLTVTVGALQAQHALTILLGKQPDKHMLIIHMDKTRFDKVHVKQRVDCFVCIKKRYEHMSDKQTKIMSKGCGSYMFFGQPRSLTTLAKRLESKGKVENFKTHIRVNEITIFKDGRVLVRADSEEEAKALHKRYIK